MKIHKVACDLKKLTELNIVINYSIVYQIWLIQYFSWVLWDIL